MFHHFLFLFKSTHTCTGLKEKTNTNCAKYPACIELLTRQRASKRRFTRESARTLTKSARIHSRPSLALYSTLQSCSLSLSPPLSVYPVWLSSSSLYNSRLWPRERVLLTTKQRNRSALSDYFIFFLFYFTSLNVFCPSESIAQHRFYKSTTRARTQQFV